MPKPVRKLQDGGYTLKHLHNLMYEVYTIIVVFNLGRDRSMDINELAHRIKRLSKYRCLSLDEQKEMLVVMTGISFLFRCEVQDNIFYIRERICT